MSQHDYSIANQSGAAFRSDLNDALAAIVSQNSGATEPTATFAHMTWVDTSGGTPVLKIRNAANSAWITIGNVATNFGMLPLAGGALTGALLAAVGSAAAPGLSFDGDSDTGFFRAAANAIGFATNGVEVVRIDSSGNVGIGTNSPSYPLSLGGTAYGVKVALRFNTNEYAIGVETNELRLASYSATTFYSGGYAGTERMRLTSGGKLCIGNNGSGNGVALAVEGSSASDALMNFKDTRGDGASNVPMCYFQRTGGTVGSINTTTSSTSYSTSSDYRLKENVAPMTGALDVVSALKPVTYKWKIDGSDGQGFIAHELQAVVPDCVTGEKDAVDAEGKPQYQAIDTSFLVATLTAAIQELNAKVEALKAQL